MYSAVASSAVAAAYIMYDCIARIREHIYSTKEEMKILKEMILPQQLGDKWELDFLNMRPQRWRQQLVRSICQSRKNTFRGVSVRIACILSS